jgi:hypothetical protein
VNIALLAHVTTMVAYLLMVDTERCRLLIGFEVHLRPRNKIESLNAPLFSLLSKMHRRLSPGKLVRGAVTNLQSGASKCNGINGPQSTPTYIISYVKCQLRDTLL